MSIVYILTNEAMPDYIKIGVTDDLKRRMKELYGSGVPLPYQCYYAATVADKRDVEKRLHKAFDDYRKNKGREFFFQLDPHKVQTILEMIAIKEVTPKEDVFFEPDDKKALERVSRYGRRFSFASVNIPIGATLNFVQDENITSIVHSDTSVIYEGQELSISKAALLATHACGYKSSTAAGPWYWLYNGETLNTLRSLAEDSIDE
jgi:T5orf172 domain